MFRTSSAGVAVRRPPRGGRGLKLFDVYMAIANDYRRPPRGGRGLKFLLAVDDAILQRGRPPRGGRGLKSHQRRERHLRHRVALLAEGVD